MAAVGLVDGLIRRRGAGPEGVEDAVDALRDTTELVALLIGWRWQAVHAARVQGAGWEQIGSVPG